MDHQFRSVAFGGFHKQDVLNFLEASSRDHAQQLQELQKQLEEQIERTEKAQTEADSLLTQAEKAEGELHELREQTWQLTDELDRTRAERDELCAQLEQARRRAEQLEPDATAYTALKERAAGVELEAHRRAQKIEDRAQEQVRQTRERARAWLDELEQAYADLRADMESTVARAREQLSCAAQDLDRVGMLMQAQGERLSQLGQLCAEQEESEDKTQA